MTLRELVRGALERSRAALLEASCDHEGAARAAARALMEDDGEVKRLPS